MGASACYWTQGKEEGNRVKILCFFICLYKAHNFVQLCSNSLKILQSTRCSTVYHQFCSKKSMRRYEARKKVHRSSICHTIALQKAIWTESKRVEMKRVKRRMHCMFPKLKSSSSWQTQRLPILLVEWSKKTTNINLNFGFI